MESTRETRRSTRTNRGQPAPPNVSPSTETSATKKRTHTQAAGRGSATPKQPTTSKPAGKGRGPGKPRKQTPEQTVVVEEIVVDEEKPEPLPHKVNDGEPLPTLREPQSLQIPTDEYQSIAQSAVLAASLKRSRDAWTSGSYFTKYYTKTIPKKVKDRTAEDKEQMARDKQLLKNMVRIGECSLTIDPHIFRVALYMTRELHGSNANRQHQQWGASPHATFSHPQYKNSTPPQQHLPYHKGPTPTNGHPQPQTPYSMPYTPPQSSAPKYQPAPTPPPRVQTTTTPGSVSTPATAPRQPNRPPGATSAQAAPDPVIHMLAQRAGTDPKLKAVMKIVAAGKATPQQLEYFQGHINELTSILEARQKAAAANQTATPTPHHRPGPNPSQPVRPPQQSQTPSQAQSQAQSQQQAPPQGQAQTGIPSRALSQTLAQSPGVGHSSTPGPVAAATPSPITGNQQQALDPHMQKLEQPADIAGPRPAYSTPAGGQGFSQATPHQSPAPARHTPLHPYNQVPPALSSPYPPPPPKPTFRPIYFEFIEGPGDRLTFPENSILEYLPGGRQVRFSFLVTKTLPEATSSTAASNSKDAEGQKQYYQSVTASLYSENPHSLECLSRAVKPAEEVRKHMEGVFDSMERAEERFLALRLPKEVEGGKGVESRVGDQENEPGILDAASAAKKRKTIGYYGYRGNYC